MWEWLIIVSCLLVIYSLVMFGINDKLKDITGCRKMGKRILLKKEVAPKGNFTFKCETCNAMLFSTDIYCPMCGENVQNAEVMILKGKVTDTSDDDYNKPMEEPV